MPSDAPLPPSDDQAAAIAAMREEWARIEPEVSRARDPEADEDEEDERLTHRSELFRDFLDRHGSLLVAMGLAPEMADAASLEVLQRRFLEADDEVKKREEELLQTQADAAEALSKLSVAGLRLLAQYEAIPQTQWDELEPDARRTTYETLELLREHREEMLGELPLEQRREWERRLGL